MRLLLELLNREGLVKFSSNEQPSPLTSPNNIEKQLLSTTLSKLSKTKKTRPVGLESYREYKRREKLEKNRESVLPRLKKIIYPKSVQNVINKQSKGEDISPII